MVRCEQATDAVISVYLQTTTGPGDGDSSRTC